MKACDPIKKNGEYVCRVCGWGVGKGITVPFIRDCQSTMSEVGSRMPGVRKRIQRWSTAIRKWSKAGKPVRPLQEVCRIYRTVCQPCEHINAAKTACKICGCRVNESKQALVNKIRMATEQCPLGEHIWAPPTGGGSRTQTEDSHEGQGPRA
jgi:hypothetical protein